MSLDGVALHLLKKAEFEKGFLQPIVIRRSEYPITPDDRMGSKPSLVLMMCGLLCCVCSGFEIHRAHNLNYTIALLECVM